MAAHGWSQKSQLSTSWASYGAGLSWGIALLFRNQGICIFFALLFFIKKIPSEARKTLRASLATILILGSFFSFLVRQPMLTSLNFGCNALIGHLPGAALVTFAPPGKGFSHSFGSPGAVARGAKTTYHFPFAVFDNFEALSETLKLAKQNFRQFLSLSFLSVRDLFFGNLPWPSNSIEFFHFYLKTSEMVVLILGYLPAFFLFIKSWISKRKEAGLFGIVFCSIFFLCLMSFVTIGETRFRVPFDGSVMMLATVFWLGFFQKLRNYFVNES